MILLLPISPPDPLLYRLFYHPLPGRGDSGWRLYAFAMVLDVTACAA